MIPVRYELNVYIYIYFLRNEGGFKILHNE
jgi:hypothetical protein